MSRLHTNPGQPSRHLYHALRPAVGQRTIRIRPFPFIPLHGNTMPQQHAIHHPSFVWSIWFIWSVSSISFIWFKETNLKDQRDRIDQRDVPTLYPIFYAQARHALEFAVIVGDQGHPQTTCVRSNQQIHSSNALASFFEMHSN